MENNICISIVTVCRNALNALQKTADSVFRQNFDNIEYIIVDGASSDGTQEWLKTIDNNRVKWISEKDDGIYDAMNKASAMATGEYVIFMNAGDIFASDNVLSTIFHNKIDADVVYGDVEKQDKDGKWYVKKAESPHNSHRMFFCHQSSFVRRELLIKYPFDTSHRYSADLKLIKTLFINNYSFCQTDVVVSRFDTSGISNTNRAAGLADNIAVVKEVDSFIEQIRLLPRLYFVYILATLRQRRKRKS